VVLLITFTFTYVYLPETLGKTVAEIEQIVAEKHKYHSSSNYGSDLHNKRAVILSVENLDFI